MNYIHQRNDWPKFRWDESKFSLLLSQVRHHQGIILGRMQGIGFGLRAEATLQTLTLDVLKSSEIEGEILDPGQVRSSIARRLGMDIAGLVLADRNVEGIVEMMLDATQHYDKPLTQERLFGWHAALFPTGRSGMTKIVVGNWRNNPDEDPMVVVSGPMGKEKVHYKAPDSELLPDEMQKFLKWFNSVEMEPVLKSSIAHLWLVTIHPFDDGNGRIARAVADMQLARTDGTPNRFYSMSAQIRKEKNAYYDMLESTQKGDMNITRWMEWFLQCLDRALEATDETLAGVLAKAKFWERNINVRLNERQQLMLNKLLDGFDGKLTTSKWAKITKTSQDTALRDVQDLLAKNIIVREDPGGRSTSYLLVNDR